MFINTLYDKDGVCFVGLFFPSTILKTKCELKLGTVNKVSWVSPFAILKA